MKRQLPQQAETPTDAPDAANKVSDLLEKLRQLDDEALKGVHGGKKDDDICAGGPIRCRV